MVVGFALMMVGPVGALSEIAPEDYLALAAKSPRIVLIDVEGVKIESSQISKGLEVREVVVTGKRIETIRGDDAGAEFRNASRELRVSDYEKARKFYSEGQLEMFSSERPHRGSLCKKGHRYLVIFDGGDTIYFEVSKKDDGWRKKMLEIQKRTAEEEKAADKGQ